AAWRARCAALHEAGRFGGGDDPTRAAESLEILRAGGWTDAAIASAAASTALDLWRSIGATYAAAYSRSGSGDMPCGFGFATLDPGGREHAPTATERAAWWADASGIPPGAAVGLVDRGAGGADPALAGQQCLADLWARPGATGDRLRAGVAMTRASL